MSDLASPSDRPTGADARTDPFRQMAESAPIGLVASRPDGDVVFANARWREITGITHPTPIPLGIIEPVMHPDDREALTQAYLESGASLRAFEMESRLVRPDGEVRHILAKGTPVVDEHGALSGFVGIAVDMTAEVALGEARRRSEERFRQLVAQAPLGHTMVDLEGRIIEVNRAYCDLVGAKPEDLVGTSALALVHPDNRGAAVEMASQLLAGEAESLSRERRLVRADGSTIWVTSMTTLERDAAGEPLGFFALAMDISERKAAEDALRLSEARYRKLIDEAPVGQVLSNLSGELVEVNQAFVDMLGISREELLARDPRSLMHPDDLPGYEREVARMLAGQVDSIDHQRRLLRPDGQVVWVSGGTSLIHENGEVFLYAVTENVTDRHLALEALTESENRFRTLTESIPVGIYQATIEGVVTYTNPQLAEITGITTPPGTWNDAMAPVHPDDQKRVGRGLLGVLRDGSTYHDRYRVFAADGTLRWLSNRATPTLDDSGAITGIIGSLEDVTELVAAQEQNTRLAEIVETASDLVGITDGTTGKLAYLNRSAREVFGLVDRDITTISAASMYSFTGSRSQSEEILAQLNRGEPWTGELAMHSADGTEMMVWQTITPILRADGTIHQVSTVGRDVTERKRFEADLAHQATHDSLTGLPNRALLLDHLELEMARAEREHRLVALLFLDLDRFKQVNDTLGHDAGDELLAQAAQRISAVVRPADTVARMGGDEFVILCGDVEDQDHATAVAHRVSAAIENRPFELAGAELAITSSIGIALSSGGVHPEAILRDADAAMYRAKDLGRARLEIYDESMRSRTLHRLELSEELANGIEKGEIVVRFQPGVDLVTGQVVCVEALARWDHPSRGLLAPHDFIGVAEDTGLIVGLGLRVLSTACEHGRRWENTFGLAAPRVHVNLSARQLTTSNLPVLVQGVLDGSGLTPSKLCLEITESVLMDDASAVIDTLWELKAIGVTLAIDDFGTGYSSLSYLRRFPVDVLKVDQSFVSGLGPDPEDSTIVAAIVNLATTLELEAIAEGVETFDQLDRLLGLGCHLGQGYLFAPAAEADRVTEMILNGFRVPSLGGSA
jgi:diguanylate cyclase (GGDEF)-like protein/PAS domain S-box-containing protein